jgi:tRNA G18 (ribose-2'-O)-methylase SpoU
MSNGFNVHDNLKDKTVEELKVISQQDRLPFAVCCLNLEYDLNIANVVRSAHLCGAEKVFIIGNNKFDRRGCVGSQNYTNIEVVKLDGIDLTLNFEKFLVGKLLSENYLPIVIDKTENSYTIENFEEKYKKIHQNLKDCGSVLINPKPCFIFGNENLGVPEFLRKFPYWSFHIPQLGVIRSFNVSSAAAIVMYEVSKILKEKKEKT